MCQQKYKKLYCHVRLQYMLTLHKARTITACYVQLFYSGFYGVATGVRYCFWKGTTYWDLVGSVYYVCMHCLSVYVYVHIHRIHMNYYCTHGAYGITVGRTHERR